MLAYEVVTCLAWAIFLERKSTFEVQILISDLDEGPFLKNICRRCRRAERLLVATRAEQ